MDFELLYDKGAGLRFESGIFTVPAGLHLKEPVIIRHKDGKKEGENALEIHLEEGARADIVEEAGDGISANQEQRRRFRVDAGGQLRYVSLQNSRVKTWKESLESQAGEGAHIHLSLFHFGGETVESQITQVTAGRHARIDSDVTVKGVEKKHFEVRGIQRFDAPEGRGEMTMSGVALDEAVLNLKGMIQITRKGGDTDTFLGESILNLSDKTRVDAAPALEIDTNDVKAGHSAGIHNLSEEDMIYLISRGLPAGQARAMMVSGFLKKALDKLGDFPEIQEAVRKLV